VAELAHRLGRFYISRRGAERLTHLRHAIDQFTGGATRPLLVCADATFTNRTVLRDLPRAPPSSSSASDKPH